MAGQLITSIAVLLLVTFAAAVDETSDVLDLSVVEQASSLLQVEGERRAGTQLEDPPEPDYQQLIAELAPKPDLSTKDMANVMTADGDEDLLAEYHNEKNVGHTEEGSSPVLPETKPATTRAHSIFRYLNLPVHPAAAHRAGSTKEPTGISIKAKHPVTSMKDTTHMSVKETKLVMGTSGDATKAKQQVPNRRLRRMQEPTKMGARDNKASNMISGSVLGESHPKAPPKRVPASGHPTQAAPIVELKAMPASRHLGEGAPRAELDWRWAQKGLDEKKEQKKLVNLVKHLVKDVPVKQVHVPSKPPVVPSSDANGSSPGGAVKLPEISTGKKPSKMPIQKGSLKLQSASQPPVYVIADSAWNSVQLSKEKRLGDMASDEDLAKLQHELFGASPAESESLHFHHFVPVTIPFKGSQQPPAGKITVPPIHKSESQRPVPAPVSISSQSNVKLSGDTSDIDQTSSEKIIVNPLPVVIGQSNVQPILVPAIPVKTVSNSTQGNRTSVSGFVLQPQTIAQAPAKFDLAGKIADIINAKVAEYHTQKLVANPEEHTNVAKLPMKPKVPAKALDIPGRRAAEGLGHPSQKDKPPKAHALHKLQAEAHAPVAAVQAHPGLRARSRPTQNLTKQPDGQEAIGVNVSEEKNLDQMAIKLQEQMDHGASLTRSAGNLSKGNANDTKLSPAAAVREATNASRPSNSINETGQYACLIQAKNKTWGKGGAPATWDLGKWQCMNIPEASDNDISSYHVITGSSCKAQFYSGSDCKSPTPLFETKRASLNNFRYTAGTDLTKSRFNDKISSVRCGCDADVVYMYKGFVKIPGSDCEGHLPGTNFFTTTRINKTNTDSAAACRANCEKLGNRCLGFKMWPAGGEGDAGPYECSYADAFWFKDHKDLTAETYFAVDSQQKAAPECFIRTFGGQ